MTKDNNRGMNRREFVEKSAKTIAVVTVGSMAPISITMGSCTKDDENSSEKMTKASNKAEGDRLNKEQINNYYVSRKSDLLESYDKGAEPLGKILALRFDYKQANAILIEARQEFETLIPKLPYIGGEENFNTKNLIMASSCLAIYTVLKKHGKTKEDVGKMIYEMTETLVDYPAFILHLIGRLKYGKGYEKKMKVWARESQRRRYPEDWVGTFIEGDRRQFDYGIDMTECGILKFFRAQGAEAIVPYICVSMDGIFSKAFNRGLVRTMTLAEGYDRCDFRYKRGRATFLLPLKDGWPPKFRQH